MTTRIQNIASAVAIVSILLVNALARWSSRPPAPGRSRSCTRASIPMTRSRWTGSRDSSRPA